MGAAPAILQVVRGAMDRDKQVDVFVAFTQGKSCKFFVEYDGQNVMLRNEGPTLVRFKVQSHQDIKVTEDGVTVLDGIPVE